MSIYIVDNVFTANGLHLIFGPPRSGTTTLLYQTMWDWANGRNVFGEKSNPAHYCLVDAIRPLHAMRRSLSRLGLPPADIPHVSLMEATTHEDRTIDALFRRVRDVAPMARVVFLDGLQALFHGNVIHYREVLNFTIDIAKHCLQRQMTLIATLNTAKSLEGTDTPVLQRIMGSTAWLASAGTLIHIGWEQGQELKPERTVTRFSPESAPAALSYTFTASGALECIGDASLQPELDKWLQQVAGGSDIPVGDIVTAGESRGLSRATTYRWIKQQVELGQLVRVDKGVLRKPNIETN